MRGTPFRGSTSSVTFEGVYSIVSSFGIADLNHKELFTIHPTGGTCSVNFNELSTGVCNYLKNVTSDVQDQIDTCLKAQEGTVHLTDDITLSGSYMQNDINIPYKFTGVTPNDLHCLSSVHTNEQHQFNTINAVSETVFKVVDGLIKLTEDIALEEYNKHGDAYTFAGATPVEITHLNGVTLFIQSQFDDVNTELDLVNTELELCIKAV